MLQMWAETKCGGEGRGSIQFEESLLLITGGRPGEERRWTMNVERCTVTLQGPWTSKHVLS